MWHLLSNLTSEHDLQTISLAAVVCIHASFTAITLFHRARDARGWARVVWIATCAVTTGSGIWATQIIGTLAFGSITTGLRDLSLIGLSFIAAVIVTGSGVRFAVCGPNRWNAPLGGAIVGSGIALSNYIGISAFGLSEHVTWYSDYIFISIALSVLFGTAALMVAAQGQKTRVVFVASLLLMFGIIGQQVMATRAAVALTEAADLGAAFSLSPASLALLIAGGSVLVLEVGLVGAFMDRRATAEALEAAARFRGLAEATSEGLAICDGDLVVDVNSRFERLTGKSNHQLCGTKLRDSFHDVSATTQIGPYSVELALQGPDGESVPCEVFARTVVCGDRARTVVTFNDLRERRRSEARIAHLVHHDALTDLPNRVAFNEKLAFTLARASTTGEPFAVLAVDLDRFKEVNDTFGHPVGDALLKQVSQRLFSAAGSAFLARIGGDEFMLIAADGEEPATATALASRLVAAVIDDIEVEGHRLQTSISVGIAVFPTDGTDMTTLLRNADAALYRAKAEGRNVIRFFDTELATRLRETRILKQDLESAAAAHEFILHYQPQARMDGQITGFEVLARWRHPTRGLVSPDAFIPLMEENGLIIPVGEWILREACREAASWREPLNVAVNLSPIQFRRDDLAHLVLSILLETGLSPNRLELEMTEGVLIDDFSRALQILRNLKALGVGIVMDDFGSGYSSLSYLQSFPFNKIKIDKTFISTLGQNSDSATIVRAAIALARGLGLTVIAEGVETYEQHALLAREKCDQVQGYLIGRPQVIDDYSDLINGASVSTVQLALTA